jgi:hypothetical protein
MNLDLLKGLNNGKKHKCCVFSGITENVLFSRNANLVNGIHLKFRAIFIIASSVV